MTSCTLNKMADEQKEGKPRRQVIFTLNILTKLN